MTTQQCCIYLLGIFSWYAFSHSNKLLNNLRLQLIDIQYLIIILNSPQRICKEIVNVQNSNLSCNCACSRSRHINIELTLQFEAERGIILFMDILPGNQVDVQEYLCKWVWKYPGSPQKQVLLNRSVFWLCVQLSTARFKQGHQDGKVLEIIYILNQL